MGSLTTASQIFSDSVLEFQKSSIQTQRARANFEAICELYKSFLDGNYAGRFCINGHCKTVYMIEIRLDDGKWGAAPKMHDTQEEAEIEVEKLKQKYPFITECNIVTRKLEEERTNERTNE